MVCTITSDEKRKRIRSLSVLVNLSARDFVIPSYHRTSNFTLPLLPPQSASYIVLIHPGTLPSKRNLERKIVLLVCVALMAKHPELKKIDVVSRATFFPLERGTKRDVVCS